MRIGGKREILGTATRTSVDLSWLGRTRLFDEGRRREGSGDSETKHRNGGAGSHRSSPKDATDLLHRTENQACGPAGAWRTFHPLWLLNTLGRTPIFTSLPDSHRSAPHNAFTHSSYSLTPRPSAAFALFPLFSLPLSPSLLKLALLPLSLSFAPSLSRALLLEIEPLQHS